jgi:hypothetical protein
VGLSELNAVRSYISQILAHLLKLRGWRELDADQYWRGEIIVVQGNLSDRVAPSMRQRIDLSKIYDRVRQQIALTTYGGKSALPSPAICPVTLDQLVRSTCAELEQAFATATGHESA